MVRIRTNEVDEKWSAGFTSENDVFQRKDLADRLSTLYASLEQGSVALLGGEWGVGKTTFVKMWRAMLSTKGIPSVYVDSFAQDYISDPFEALCGTFVRAAHDAHKEDSNEFREFATRAAGVGKRLLPTLAKIGIKAATIGVVGSSEIEAVQAAIETSADAASDAVEERLKDILKDHAQAEHGFEALRRAITDLVTKIDDSKDDQSTPRLVIIIDELDRCRPLFAVGLLEIIKHFFRAENVHFVIVTQSKSLTKSFAAVHNLGDEAGTYLQKFYDFTIHLMLPSGTYGRQYIKQYVSQAFREVLGAPHKTQFSYDLEEMCVTLAVAHNLSPRQINSFILTASLCLSSMSGKQDVSAMLVSHLILMKVIRPDLYFKAKRGALTWQDMREIIPADLDNEGYNSEHVYNVFGHFLVKSLEELPEDYKDVGRGRFGLSREGFIPYLANSVVDLFAQPTG